VILGSCLTATVVRCTRLPRAGETVIAESTFETLGGKGLNMAVQAARLGAEVFFVGVVGDDEGGRTCEAALLDAGANTDYLVRVPHLSTGHGVILRDRNGENAIAVDRGAAAAFSRQTVNMARPIMNGEAVLLAQQEIPIDAVLNGCCQAHGNGAITILNPAPAEDLRGRSLRCVDVLTPNETEAPVCAGIDTEEDDPSHHRSAREMLVAGCGAVIVTRGGDGSVLFRDQQTPVAVPAFPVATVDTTGAGDSYNAALAVGLAEGRRLEDAMRLASAASALCCSREDTVPAYPSRAELVRFLAAPEG
jgi:ribokinase